MSDPQPLHTSTIPHWTQVGITIGIVCITAILTANSNGDLALPMIAISVLSVVKLALGLLSDSWATVRENKKALENQRLPSTLGFARMSVLLWLAALGAIGLGTGATCTPAEAVQVAVQVAVDVCSEAPLLIPPGTPVGTVVALICAVVDPKTGLPKPGGQTVFMPADQWRAMKLDYLKTHPALPGGMSRP